MLNERQEFLDYTEPVEYRASGKKDTTWLGRFTFEALRDFSGMNRILTILARGFLFHDSEGALLPGDPRERIDYARDGLCAWCSIPERDSMPKEAWQHRTNFAPLHNQFPKLVDEMGWGWFSRHFHRAMRFAASHPESVHKNYADSAGRLDKLFDRECRSKVLQYQTKSLSILTEGAWTIRFDYMIADALELDPLRHTGPELPAELAERLEQVRPTKMPSNVLPTLLAYYLANRPEEDGWVVLPVTNFDCYFGNTNFGRKYLNQLPQAVIERGSSFGVSRYRVREEYLPK